MAVVMALFTFGSSILRLCPPPTNLMFEMPNGSSPQLNPQIQWNKSISEPGEGIISCPRRLSNRSPGVVPRRRYSPRLFRRGL